MAPNSFIMLHSLDLTKVDQNIQKAHLIDLAIMNDSVESLVKLSMTNEEIINFEYNITENNDLYVNYNIVMLAC